MLFIFNIYQNNSIINVVSRLEEFDVALFVSKNIKSDEWYMPQLYKKFLS